MRVCQIGKVRTMDFNWVITRDKERKKKLKNKIESEDEKRKKKRKKKTTTPKSPDAWNKERKICSLFSVYGKINFTAKARFYFSFFFFSLFFFFFFFSFLVLLDSCSFVEHYRPLICFLCLCFFFFQLKKTLVSFPLSFILFLFDCKQRHDPGT